MKRLRITVEGRLYDVQVEVLEDDEGHVPGAGLTPVSGRGNGERGIGRDDAPPLASTPAAGAPPACPIPGARTDRSALAAPIAGAVQKIFVEQGALIEAHAPVLLLDAMKMDTYIYAPSAARVQQICVGVGDAVQVGQVLVRFQPQD